MTRYGCGKGVATNGDVLGFPFGGAALNSTACASPVNVVALSGEVEDMCVSMATSPAFGWGNPWSWCSRGDRKSTRLNSSHW